MSVHQPSKYPLLDEHEEQELHKSRLLNVEEKPFKRLLKRLVLPGAYTNPIPSQLLTPTPENGHGNASQQQQDAAAASAAPPAPTDVATIKEDIALDFAAYDANIARLQFLATANASERARYADDRLRILETMETVRAGNAGLRVQLEGARATLAQRKRFDELADRITASRMLRTRAEQEAALAKLAEECDELEREAGAYGGTWRDRKGQFDKLVDEGTNLRRLIRDEKEEVERREGMDEDGEDDSTAAATPGGGKSGNATPRRSDDNGTPRSPGRPGSPGAQGGGEGGLKVPGQSEYTSRGGSQAPSFWHGSPLAGTPQAASEATKDEPEEGEDVEMGDSTRASHANDTPVADGGMEGTQPAVDAPSNGDTMDTT